MKLYDIVRKLKEKTNFTLKVAKKNIDLTKSSIEELKIMSTNLEKVKLLLREEFLEDVQCSPTEKLLLYIDFYGGEISDIKSDFDYCLIDIKFDK